MNDLEALLMLIPIVFALVGTIFLWKRANNKKD